MRGYLLASPPGRDIRSGPFAASAAAHVVIIAAVLMATRGTGSHAHGWNDAREITTVVQLRFAAPAPARATAPERADSKTEAASHTTRSVSAGEPPSLRERLASLKVVFDGIADRAADVRPTLDADDIVRNASTGDAKAAAVPDSEFSHGTTPLADAVRPAAPLVNNGVYTPELVDEQVSPRPGNPKPVYPEAMRASGIEADVNVLFVVDTTGHVEEPTIRFVDQVHELFMDAIRVSLRRARFFPARLAGSVVPQLVQQRFRFQLRDR
jgi:TonB family protein